MEVRTRVLSELQALRKRPDAASIQSLAQSPTICSLIGNDNPGLSYNALKHHLLAQSEHLPLIAAAYSLGFASKADTHLGRLEDFGAEFGYEVRQARRLSDQGLDQLAGLITTHWAAPHWPNLSAVAVTQSPEEVRIAIFAESRSVIVMRPIEITVQTSSMPDVTTPVALPLRHDEDEVGRQTWKDNQGFVVPITDEEVSVSFVWGGEALPKWGVQFIGDQPRIVAVEALGTRMMLHWYGRQMSQS